MPGTVRNLLHAGPGHAIQAQPYQCLLFSLVLYGNGNDDDTNTVGQAA